MSKIVTKTIDVNKPLKLNAEAKKRLDALKTKEDIDLSDIPETTPDDWKNAIQNPFYKPLKQTTTIRIDKDVLMWLKSKGKGYQTRLNQILRQAMLDDLA